MSRMNFSPANTLCRTPHGVRGLKYRGIDAGGRTESSHPAWGAWIEICVRVMLIYQLSSRTPHGVRGLKWRRSYDAAIADCRTPHGVRGLKSHNLLRYKHHAVVAPRMGCVD